MGEGAKKKRAAEARAAKKAKLELAKAAQLEDTPQASGPSTNPASSDITTQSTSSNSKKTGTAPPPPREPSDVRSGSTRRSTRSLVSSTLGSGKKDTSANLEDDDNRKSRPKRSATAAALALLKELQVSETEEAEGDPEGVFTGNEDEDDDGGTGGDSDEGSDGSDIVVIEKPSAVAQKGLPKVPPVRRKAKLQAIHEDLESSDESDSDAFDMTFEINDKARGARKNITLPSYTSLDTLKDKVAQVLNLHPGSLQLQYRFSNEKSNVLPFDLVSIEDYHDMCDRLRCLVGPKILASGKPSKTPRKLVTVQLFNKSTEGILASGEKSIKKSSKAPGDVDTSSTKHDELFEKKKVVIEELTNYWSCDIHSLPDKPALCWKPVEQRPHGDCYPITQSNINFWASCIVREPTAFSVEEKPRQLNLLNNAPRRHGSSINSSMHAQPGGPQAPFPMPYGFYPPPNPFFANPVQWPGAGFPQPPGPQANPTVLPAAQPAPPAAPPRLVRGPAILQWLVYCDHVPGRGDFFYGLADKFEREGYRTIDQLTSSRMTVEDLSNWLGIGKGTADLIIQYANEDMALVREGKFTMERAIFDGDGEDIY